MQPSNVVHTSSANFPMDVLQSKVPVVVDFYADWCGPCRMVAPIVEQLAGEFDGKVRFAKVDVDQNADLAMRYGVQSIPTVIFLRGGAEITRLIGAASKDHYRRQITSLLDGVR